MHLPTDLEFEQNQIKKLSDEFNVDMFHTKVRGGKAFAAEQKTRQFKKILLRSKRFEKISNKRIRPNNLIKNPAQNMNQTISTKYLQKRLKNEVQIQMILNVCKKHTTL